MSLDSIWSEAKPYVTTWYGVLIIFYVAFSVLQKLNHKRLEKKLGCKPPQNQPTDHMLGFRNVMKLMNAKASGDLMYFTYNRFEQNGNTIFNLVAGSPMFATREPENIKAILGTQFNDFDLGIRYNQMLPLLGDGIFTLDNQGWKHSRAMLRPQFAREQVAHVKALEPHVQRIMAHVRKNKGQFFDIQDIFFKFTLDSATEFLFGESVESLCDGTIDIQPTGELDTPLKWEFPKAFNDAQATLSTRAILKNLYWMVNHSTFRKNCKIAHGLTDIFVEKALNMSQEDLDKKLQDSYTFLYELVRQTRDPKVLRDQALNILVAGRDTTAGLLSFLFLELARNPDVFAKLKQEIHDTFGAGEDARVEEISFDTLKRCEYLKAVINETLRLYPSVPQNFRTANKNTSIPRGGGADGNSPVFIPKGSVVAYSISATHRTEAYYGKDADVFRPERWFEEHTRKLGWAYLPFNGGPRICLGQQFALTEASYVVTRLLQEFPNLKGDQIDYPPKVNSQLTMCLLDGAKVSLS